MVSVETIGKIRRAWHVHGRSIRSIARSMGVSRNTVRKVLRSDGSAPKYQRSDQPHAKLGDFIPELERKLEANKGKKPRDRLSMKRIWRQLADQGCDASYSAVCRYAAAWDRRNGGGVSGAHVPLEFDPGEAFQFDWSHEWAVIGGTTMRLRVAHMRLCHSRMSYVRAYPARDPGDGLRRPQPGVRGVRRLVPAGNLRQHEDGRGRHLRGADAQVQRPLPGDVRALPRGAGGLHAERGVGEGPGGILRSFRSIRARSRLSGLICGP